MRVCVAGLWHLGSVTAACLAEVGHDVIGYDEDEVVVGQLNRGEPPLFEPGLTELVRKGLTAGRLQFSTNREAATDSADVLWIAYDTPVDGRDNADVSFVIDRARALLPTLPRGALVIVSSQLPVGSVRIGLAMTPEGSAQGRDLHFACLPENLRLGKAIEVFTKPDRVVAGIERTEDQIRIKALLGSFTSNILFMSIESAEMTKHAINAFLAMSVAFANEIASVCESVGADAAEVATGLRTESRIGPGAYVSPGVAFSGGTLARDISFLTRLQEEHGLKLSLIPSVTASNDQHRAWPMHRLRVLLGNLSGRRIALLGLTYKPGTDTLRRSYAIELARMLLDAGAEVCAFDPVVRDFPADFDFPITLAPSVAGALAGADAAVIATEWPAFRDEDWATLVTTMAQPLLIDPKGHLRAQANDLPGTTYAVVGRVNTPLGDRR